jgi:hypothetical protein
MRVKWTRFFCSRLVQSPLKSTASEPQKEEGLRGAVGKPSARPVLFSFVYGQPLCELNRIVSTIKKD